MTAHETLKSFGIDVQRLHDEKPMLYTNIIRSMEEYAQQQVKSVDLADVVSSGTKLVCDYCNGTGNHPFNRSGWPEPCPKCG